MADRRGIPAAVATVPYDDAMQRATGTSRAGTAAADHRAPGRGSRRTGPPVPVLGSRAAGRPLLDALEVPDLPLDEVPFAVVDVETTGGSPLSSALTEIAVGLVVGGRCVSVTSWLVDPGVPIPPFITDLTGISDATVADAPPVAEVLPALLGILDGRVLVGHNLPFDVGFLDVALAEAGLPTLAQPMVDTLTLARHLLRGSVPNCRLGTLAEVLELPHQPSHRAAADVLATADLLQHLLARLAPTGVRRLSQLLAA